MYTVHRSLSTFLSNWMMNFFVKLNQTRGPSNTCLERVLSLFAGLVEKKQNPAHAHCYWSTRLSVQALAITRP